MEIPIGVPNGYEIRASICYGEPNLSSERNFELCRFYINDVAENLYYRNQQNWRLHPQTEC